MKTINVGEHRGKGRIWLEGNWLKDAGFIRGVRYGAVITGNQVEFKIAVNGSRKVSGKGDRPIIDMNSSELAPFIGACELVFISTGHMILRKAGA